MAKKIDLKKKTKISKTELIANVAANLDLPKDSVATVVNAMLDEIG